MKYILTSLSTILLLSLFSACRHGGAPGDEGKVYGIAATVEEDSTLVLDHLVLYSDNHVNMRADSLIPTPQHKIEHEGRTTGLDELYLCSDQGELCRFYASGGMEVAFVLKTEDGVPSASYAESSSDTINAWLQSQKAMLAGKDAEECRKALDDLCHQRPYDVRCALLLRDEIEEVGDSLFVRRCLGALTEEAKPNWLTKSIDQILTGTSNYLTLNHRLANCTFKTDSADFKTGDSRSEYLLIYCWAQYSPASMDTLRMLNHLINEEYAMKRLKLFSCCLDAPDSLWWENQIRGIGGRHVWVKAGLTDKRMHNWRIDRVPAVILCDMYNNQQQRNVWGAKLREALDRVPNRSGFVHTVPFKPNGRPNNLSRPRGH